MNKKIEELIDKPHVTIIDIKDKLETIGELATYKYNYTAVEKYEDFAHLFKAKLDFTKSSYIVRWSGVIKAGIDTEKVTKGINPHTKTITIGLPAAQILSHDPDEENAEILELKENIFNPISVESVYEFDAKVKKELEAKAIEEGLLEKARENAEAVIESIFYSEIEKYGYTIKFVDSKK